MTRLRLLLAPLVGLAVMIHTPSLAAGETYRFGVVPQQAAKHLARAWGPIFRHLSERTGDRYLFSTAPNIPEFEKRVAAGQYDVAYMNPYHFTVFAEEPGYQALVRAKDKKIRGIVVVRKDSKITDISELNGRELAFPAPAAFAASVLPRSEFSRANVSIKPKYVSSHDSVYRTVAKGLYPAGGGVLRTFSNVAPAVRDQLRILWKTEPYTPHAIATHPGMNAQARERLLAVLVEMHMNEESAALLTSVRLKGFIAASHEDWDDVRALDIQLLGSLAGE